MGNRDHGKITGGAYKVNRYGSPVPKTGIPKAGVPTKSSMPVFKKKKKLAVVEEPVAPKKKKPVTHSHELAVVEPTNKQKRTLQKFDKLAETAERVQSTFGLRESQIMDLIEAGDIDGSIHAFQKQAYGTIINLIPIAEEEYRKGKRDHQAYVLNALISQSRELAADLMASGDRQSLAAAIVSEILEPTFKAILQFMMQEQMQLKAILTDKIFPQHQANAVHEIDSSLKNVAASMTSLYKMSADNITKKLLGD